MKVAVLFDNFGPYHLARLRAASRECSLLALELNRLSRDYRWGPSVGPRRFHSVTLPASGAPGPFKSIIRAYRLRRILTHFDPDCLFIPGWSCGYALLAWRWARRHGVPVVIMSESTEHDLPRRGWKEWFKRRVVRSCSAALVGGKLHREYLVKLGLPRDRIFQGYDVVDNDYFRRRIKAVRQGAVELRSRFGLPRRYLLASARFVESKNLRGLLAAYARYRHALKTAPADQSQPPSLVLLGDGAQRPVLQRLISELGLDSSVLLPGFRQYAELPVYYGLADAFVHASASEPWGLVVNEAMASGLPVLVSIRCGCVPELVRQGINGFTFDPQDIDELSQLMLRISRLQSQLPIMGQASAKTISDWGPNRFAQGFRSAALKALAKCSPQKETSAGAFQLGSRC